MVVVVSSVLMSLNKCKKEKDDWKECERQVACHDGSPNAV